MSLAHRLGFAAVACLLAAPLPAGAALIMRKDLSHEMALAVAEGAMQACLAKGYATSAVVVDRDGETLVAMRGDGAGPHTVENARRKAYTANTFKQPTAEYAKKLLDPGSVAHQQVTLPSIIAIDGGVPIKVGNDVIGAAGLSGSPGIHDSELRQRRYRKDQRPIAVAAHSGARRTGPVARPPLQSAKDGASSKRRRAGAVLLGDAPARIPVITYFCRGCVEPGRFIGF